MAKIVVCGSRTIIDYSFIKTNLDRLVNKDDTIVSGGANGVDKLAEKYAKETGMDCVVFNAQWKVGDKLDRGAGYKRNVKMIDYADSVICLWNGMSKGTKHSIDYAKKHNKLMEVIYI